ncbi:thiol reductant ABC exporter subunit CydC [Rhodoblastus acidophilus]|uniref:Thiol reductant ABC exporter subunit CydC n=1 Tax=Candidatus Rhodoblastus alkanivorans TaxID=2954117 RepID=A0ABS9Z3Y7_9HYPH|nr:thiol reductant ABC exporter subunit CydC [Candidatus Rhodoblastus alkanivorans]MCI4677335.1 thiol reductant ABC exporter subunit CydC [Candidatus Rhodoblastus alkanivorans]MCI4682070.1 thiol reductant ABC exporter subunit CydC [Candidatus Rhodoblastus alkanivorans]MDI4639372.1 thiol reductant ABC exporter subunit CydC [Rhodoblastus acidophilus]
MTSLWRLVGLFRPHAGWIALSILISLASLLANIGLLATSGWFIAAMAGAGLAGAAINYFTPAAVIRTFAILRTGGRYADRLISHEATLRLIARLRVEIFARLERIAPAALGDLRSGDVLASLRGDVDRLEQVFLRLFAPLIVALLAASILVAALAFWSAALAVAAALIFALAGFAAPASSALWARRPSRAVAARAAALRARLVDDLQGLAALQATGADARHFDALERQMADLLAAEADVARIGALGQACVGATVELTALAALALGAGVVKSGLIDGPQLTGGVLTALASLEAFGGVAAAFAGLFAVIASAERVFGLMDRRPVVVEPARPAPPPQGFDLKLHDVSLTFPGAARPALRNIDLDIPEGRRIAFVGASGAGKSSLSDLIVRFRDPDAGAIWLGGVELKDLPGDVIRSRIVVMRQAPHIFAASVARNLRLAKPEAAEQELWNALAAVEMEETVRALPQGLDSPVGVGGAKLSGGQAKRLALARALLTDAPILFLDEPTEGLDPDAARRILGRIIERSRGKTLLLATHRPAERAAMNEIVTLDGGRIVARRLV